MMMTMMMTTMMMMMMNDDDVDNDDDDDDDDDDGGHEKAGAKEPHLFLRESLTTVTCASVIDNSLQNNALVCSDSIKINDIDMMGRQQLEDEDHAMLSVWWLACKP